VSSPRLTRPFAALASGPLSLAVLALSRHSREPNEFATDEGDRCGRKYCRAGSLRDQWWIIASLGFLSFAGAERTIQRYEAMHMIRKGQVRWLAKGDIARTSRFVKCMFGLAS
jgi:hypothetical protein